MVDIFVPEDAKRLADGCSGLSVPWTIHRVIAYPRISTPREPSCLHCVPVRGMPRTRTWGAMMDLSGWCYGLLCGAVRCGASKDCFEAFTTGKRNGLDNGELGGGGRVCVSVVERRREQERADRQRGWARGSTRLHYIISRYIRNAASLDGSTPRYYEHGIA